MSDLFIFVSHHEPNDRSNAKDVIAALTAASPEVKAKCSGDFNAADRQQDLQMQLIQSDWLVVLATSPQHNYGRVGVEAGFFLAQHKALIKERKKRIICVHNPLWKPEFLLASQKDVEWYALTDVEARSLLLEIYGRPDKEHPDRLGIRPEWVESPAYAARVQDAAAQLVRAVGAVKPEQSASFVQSFTIHINPADDPEWKHGRIPGTCSVTGSNNWELLFGKSPGAGAWTWDSLLDGLQMTELWQPQMAAIMRDAEKSHPNPQLIPILPGNFSDQVPFLFLNRYERMPPADPAGVPPKKFHFVGAVIPPWWEMADARPHMVVFHVICAAQHFRYLIVEQRIKDLDNVIALRKAKQPAWKARFAKLQRDVLEQMLGVITDSFHHGLFANVAAIGSLPIDQAAVERLSTLGMDLWPPIQQRIVAACDGESGTADALKESLSEAAELNKEYLLLAARWYHELLKKHFG